MTDKQSEWSCHVGSNGKDDAEGTRYFVCTDDGSGLTHTVCIDRDQITNVLKEISPCTGSPHFRRDRYCDVLLTEDQVNDLGWEN